MGGGSPDGWGGRRRRSRRRGARRRRREGGAERMFEAWMPSAAAGAPAVAVCVVVVVVVVVGRAWMRAVGGRDAGGRSRMRRKPHPQAGTCSLTWSDQQSGREAETFAAGSQERRGCEKGDRPRTSKDTIAPSPPTTASSGLGARMRAWLSHAGGRPQPHRRGVSRRRGMLSAVASGRAERGGEVSMASADGEHARRDDLP